MDKELSDKIKLLAEALDKHNVQYMLVGGLAVGFYAKPRPSGNFPKSIDYDVDNYGIWLQLIILIILSVR